MRQTSIDLTALLAAQEARPARPGTSHLTRRAALAGAPIAVAAALGAGTAVTASAVALRAAQGAENADADLLELGERFEAALARYHAVCAEADRIRALVDAESPPPPRALTITLLDALLFRTAIADGLRRNDGWLVAGKLWGACLVTRLRRAGEAAYLSIRSIEGPEGLTGLVECPEAKARFDEIIAAFDRWDAERVAVEERNRNKEAEQACDHGWGVASDAAAAIERGPEANTLAGLVVKARAAAWRIGHLDPNPRDALSDVEMQELAEDGRLRFLSVIVRDVLVMAERLPPELPPNALV